jgi:hypothetical protein
MKTAYKIFTQNNGNLHSYNNPVNHPLSIEYKQGEWREPDIEGSVLFCLSQVGTSLINEIAVRNGNGYTIHELWLVEIDEVIPMDTAPLISVWQDRQDRLTMQNLRRAIANGPTKEVVKEVKDCFEYTLLTNRVRPIERSLWHNSARSGTI